MAWHCNMWQRDILIEVARFVHSSTIPLLNEGPWVSFSNIYSNVMQSRAPKIPSRKTPMQAVHAFFRREIFLPVDIHLMALLAVYSYSESTFLTLLYILIAFPMHLINHRTNKEPNNRYILVPSRLHNLMVAFLRQSRPDTPHLTPRCLQHRSAPSSPQLHIPDQIGQHSHTLVRVSLQDPFPSTAHFHQDQRLQLPLRQNSVCRVLESEMLQSRRN